MDQARLSEAVKVKREMEALTSLPGWKRLTEIARVQIEGRTNSVLLQPTSSPYEQEYLKGEIQGMKTLVSIPETVMADSKAIIDSTKTEEEIE